MSVKKNKAASSQLNTSSKPRAADQDGSQKNKAIPLIMGPTGVGKSAVAFEVAQHCGAEIVNADSLQLYKNLDIGTSKPSDEQMQAVRHHLYSVIELGARCTVGQYYRLAQPLLQKATRPMLVVGGSGFYLQALEKGLPPVPQVAPDVQKQIEHEAECNLTALYQELAACDPVAAEKIHPHDKYRIIRGVAVLRSGGNLSQIQKALAICEPDLKSSGLKHSEAQGADLKGSGLKVFKIALVADRKWLRSQLEARLEAMLKSGFIDELNSLRQLIQTQQLRPDWPPLQSVGYKEGLQYLNNQLTRDTMREQIIKRSLLLVKKQLTWLKRTQGIQYFTMPEERGRATEHLKNFLT